LSFQKLIFMNLSLLKTSCKFLMIALFFVWQISFAQTNPVPQSLPYTQDFGTTTFASMPDGMASWNGINGGSTSSLLLAETSSPLDNATITAQSGATSTGGSFGFMNSSNGRFYIQTSGNATNGANQAVLSIITSGLSDISINYDIEIINAQPRTVGIVMQYRLGESGTWTTVSGINNPFSQNGGTTGLKASPTLVLPSDANDQSIVQIRWATWRGTQSGNSSGIAIDNIFVNGSPLASESIEFANIQFPTSATITEGNTVTVFAQAYKFDFTEAAGQAPGLSAWIGYSETNDNPENSGWTWIPATFNVQAGNNDEFQVALGSGLTPGTYYYASRFQIDAGPFVYGGVGGNWNNNSAVLTVNPDVVDFANVQFPTSGNITEGDAFTVFAQVFEPGVTEAPGQGAGIDAWIGYSDTNDNPANSGWTWIAATFNTQAGNNDEYQAEIASGLPFGTYYYASRFQKTNSSVFVYGGTGGIWNNDNGTLTINALGTPVATAATSVGETSFIANWNAVSGANEYRLDVSTDINFETLIPITLFEGFSTYTNQTSFNDFTLTGTGNYTSNASSGVSGPNSVQFNDTNDRLVSPLFSDSVTSLSFWIRGNSTNASSALLIEGFNGSIWVTIQNITNSIPTTGTTFTYNSTSSPVLPENISQFRFTYTKSVGNLAFDDFSVEYNESSPNFLPGYENLNVGNVTSYNVTGLDPNTTYFYRVRAVNNSVTSGNSNVIEVTTLAAEVIWDGNAWSNTVGPDENTNAILEGAYDTAAVGAFTALNLTINTGGSLVVTSGENVTVYGNVINTQTASDLLIQHTANLVQLNNVNNNTGEITVEIESNPLLRLDYTLWSSPVAGQNLKDFSPLTVNNRFYEYSTSTNTYSNASIDPVTDHFETAKAYLIRMPDNWSPSVASPFMGTFVGEGHNGNINVTLNNEGVGQRFNAVGNPYPSSLDIATFLSVNGPAALGGNDAITGSMWFWRKTNNPLNSSYCVYNGASNIYTSNGEANAVSSNGAFERILGVGQGFILEAAGSSTEIQFTNTMRIGNNSGQFFRTAQVESASDNAAYWINLSQENGAFYQMAVSYNEGATVDLDIFDSKAFNNGSIGLNSYVSETDFAIQGRPAPFDVQDIVPLSFKASEQGSFTISLDNTIGLFNEDQDIFIKDLLTQSTHNLKYGAYTFSSNAGTFNDRFQIVYTNETLGVNQNSLNEAVVYTQGQQLFIQTLNNDELSKVSLYDLTGRRILTQEYINSAYVEISLSGISKQALLVQLQTLNGSLITRKIIF